jgi:phosphopantothenoylcysteine decarboxylase/phosphopantothenate--cysteine ligase
MTDGDLAGLRVLVTAGPTREHLDPVRFLSNPSSGRMGFALAEEAAGRGARVTLVSGPTELADPAGVATVRVTSAEEMLDACRTAFRECDVLVAAAAVSDFRPRHRHARKQPKETVELILELERTPDILATLAADKGTRFVVGFAAATGDPLPAAQAKLRAKNLDLIVANDVAAAGVGFGSSQNRVTILDRTGPLLEIGPAAKREIAAAIWSLVVQRRAARARRP